MSLYSKHRPKTLKGLIGQDGAVSSLQKQVDAGKVPHALLLSGPSGVGKTTIARILKGHLNCADTDFFEINAADHRGIEDMREIRRAVHLAPMMGDSRIWLIDEAGKLSNDAQNAFLKMLEDTPDHAYFILATTDPQKLIKTIHTRCTEVVLSTLNEKHVEQVMRRVMDKEDIELSDDIVQEIAERADGSARKALVLLEQVAVLETEQEQLEAIKATTFDKEKAIDLARLLVFRKGGWNDVCKVLRALKDQDAEGIRYCVLGYARTVLVGGEDKDPNPKFAHQAFKVLEIFADNFFDSKHPGLAAACYEVVCLKQ